MSNNFTPTPICDFVAAYVESDAVRLHMPGHKGKPRLGPEPYDITEIDGADALYMTSGIIAESERYASAHFGAHTFYSAEGSSLSIRAMLFLAATRKSALSRRVLAARNVHKAFLSAAALLDLDVVWLHPNESDGYLSQKVSAAAVERALSMEPFCAVYLTSPDYLGHTADIAAISAVCHRFGVPLLVDNAHGAYLKFLPLSRHPMDLGADLCCDSAHKTLPALTGAAYLHVSKGDLYGFAAHVKDALALFGSTSPSYLILQSLDAVNRFLDDYPARLAAFLPKVDALKATLCAHGYTLFGDEPLKCTLTASSYGYSGTTLAKLLKASDIFVEYADADVLVLMLSPDNTDAELARLSSAFLSVPRKEPLPQAPLPYRIPDIACSVREATLSPSEVLPVDACLGRVLAAPCVACPPAVPILMCGEVIDTDAIARFSSCGIRWLRVMLS